MTKGEIIKKLQAMDVPDNTLVMIYQTDDESSHNIVASVEAKPVTFGADDIPRNQWADEICIVISDY